MPSPSTNFGRRHWLASASAAATGLAVINEAAEGQNPANSVADKTTNLKISALKGSRVGTKAYIKIETNQGIFGWGEVTGLDPTVAVAIEHEERRHRPLRTSAHDDETQQATEETHQNLTPRSSGPLCQLCKPRASTLLRVDGR